MIRFPAIRRAILAERSLAANLAWTAVSIIAPTAIRWAIDRGAAGVPFVTYFPAVVLASLFLGWKWATATALFSAVVANRLFGPGLTLATFSPNDFIMAGLFAFSCLILINIGEVLRRLLQDLETAHAREAVLSAELRHRTKNMLAMVQSMAALTHRSSGAADFLEDFSDRISAMASVTDMANAQEPSQREIGLLVETATAPFRNGRNIIASGPDWKLPQKSCIPLALVLHELCTNAVKYGALSVPTGQVTIRWEVDGENALSLFWKEAGGPSVLEPARRGMGSALLRAQNGLDRVEHRFASVGVECDIVIRGDRWR